MLERTADLYETHAEEFFSLCIREGGKTLIDAVLEVREGKKSSKQVNAPAVFRAYLEAVARVVREVDERLNSSSH